MATRLTGVEIRASDVRSLSEFWRSVLGEDVVDGANGLALRFVEASGPKTAKNRVHLDLKGGPLQLARLLELGAVRTDIGQGEVPWEVLADPEGNEFCLQPPTPVDELEGTSQVALNGSVNGGLNVGLNGTAPGYASGVEGHGGIGVRWTAVCQDAADPQAQSKFWTAALGFGWQVVAEGDWGLALRRADDARSPMLVMGPPLAAKEGPNRVYLRVTPNQGSDVVVETSRLVVEGAKRQGDLLIDPEGNEFRIA
jgi:Glyoxalase-like domain